MPEIDQETIEQVVQVGHEVVDAMRTLEREKQALTVLCSELMRALEATGSLDVERLRFACCDHINRTLDGDLAADIKARVDGLLGGTAERVFGRSGG